MFDFSNKTWAILLFVNFLITMYMTFRNYSEGNMGFVIVFAVLCGYSLAACLRRIIDVKKEG